MKNPALALDPALAPDPLHVSTSIPVTESLPPIGVRVLAYTGTRWIIASLYSRWLDPASGHFINPTHWQYLPAPPLCSSRSSVKSL